MSTPSPGIRRGELKARRKYPAAEQPHGTAGAKVYKSIVPEPSFELSGTAAYDFQSARTNALRSSSPGISRLSTLRTSTRNAAEKPNSFLRLPAHAARSEHSSFWEPECSVHTPVIGSCQVSDTGQAWFSQFDKQTRA